MKLPIDFSIALGLCSIITKGYTEVAYFSMIGEVVIYVTEIKPHIEVTALVQINVIPN